VGKRYQEISPKRMCTWQISTWKDAQHHQPLGHCRLGEMQNHAEIHNRSQKSNIAIASKGGEDAEKPGLSHVAGGNVKWHSRPG